MGIPSLIGTMWNEFGHRLLVWTLEEEGIPWNEIAEDVRVPICDQNRPPGSVETVEIRTRIFVQEEYHSAIGLYYPSAATAVHIQPDVEQRKFIGIGHLKNISALSITL